MTDAIQQSVETELRASGLMPPWRAVELPDLPPAIPEVRADGPNGYVAIEAFEKSRGPEWYIYSAFIGSCFVPRKEHEPHPLRAAVDLAIEHTEAFLAWLRELQARTPASAEGGS